MGKNRIFLAIVFILFFLVTVFGISNVLNKGFSQIAWVFTPLGIFIWGDALVLGPFMMASSVFFWIKNNTYLTGMFFSLYGTIRSFIEVIYSLNAQFSSLTRPWEENWHNFSLVRAIGKTEIFVLSQLSFTCIAIISALLFIYFLKQYFKRPFDNTT